MARSLRSKRFQSSYSAKVGAGATLSTNSCGNACYAGYTARSNTMVLKTNFFSFNFRLCTCWRSSLKQVNNHYHCRKVSNYKSLHKENVLAINASGLLCRRRGAIKMLIELDLSVRWSSEVVRRTSSVANKTVKHYGVTINKAEGLRTGQSFYSQKCWALCVINPMRTCKYKQA